jgi:hypothetical protein
VDGEDLRRQPFADRKAALRKLLSRNCGGVEFVAHAEMPGEYALAAACDIGLFAAAGSACGQ